MCMNCLQSSDVVADLVWLPGNLISIKSVATDAFPEYIRLLMRLVIGPVVPTIVDGRRSVELQATR